MISCRSVHLGINTYFATRCAKLSWQEYQLDALESFTLKTCNHGEADIVAVFWS